MLQTSVYKRIQNTKSLFVKVVQKMCFDGQLQYTRYMHNLNNLLSPILALGGVEHNVVLCKTGSVLLCVLEQIRVDNFSVRPALIFTHYIFIPTRAFLWTWSLTIIILVQGFSGGIGVYLILQNVAGFVFYFSIYGNP
jgi:hypothetical protein